MKILLDTNIILDYVLERKKFVKEARLLMQISFNKELIAYISGSSITDIYYIVQKYKNKQKALFFIKEIISFIEVSNIDKTVILSAINSNFSDFEDAVHNFSAINSNIEIIVTRNPSDFKDSTIKIYTPKQFLKYFEQTK